MNKYDIYWFDVIFEEDLLSNNPQSKRRPILILDNDFIAPFVPITSHAPRTDKDYKIINWREAGLSGPSTIRFGYKRLLNRSKLGNDYIGHLSQEDITKMKELHLIESLNEDTVKQDGKWVNKGDEGTHGKFKTKKAADAQRKAMFANGYHESLEEDYDYAELEDYVRHYIGEDELSLPEIWDEVFDDTQDEDLANDVVDMIEKYRNEDEALNEAISPFVDDKVINSIRKYEMYHLPAFYTYADVDNAMRVDQIGTSSGEQPHDIIKATVCYVTPDNEEECAEHKYKVFDDGRVEAISDESLNEAIKPLSNYSSYKLAKLLTDKYYNLTMGHEDKTPFLNWFDRNFGVNNRADAASIISNFDTSAEKRVNRDDLFYVMKYVDRVANLLNSSTTAESLDEAATPFKYQVEVTVDGEYDADIDEYWIPDNLPDLLQGYHGQEPVDRSQKQWHLYYAFATKEACDKFVNAVTNMGYVVSDINDDEVGYDFEESLNEAKFSNATANDDVRLVRASYDHFMNDLGEIPSPDDILYDILDNYNQDIFQEGGPYQEGKEIEAIKYILRSQGLEYRGDFDESLNEDNNMKKFEIKKEYIDDVLENNGNAPIDAIFNPDYYYVNIIDAGDKYILEGDETNVYNMLVPFDLQWRIDPIEESLNEDEKPSFNDYMNSIFGDDDRWEENPDVEDYYRQEYNAKYDSDGSDSFILDQTWDDVHPSNNLDDYSAPKEEEPEEYEMTEEDYANMLDSYNITLEMSDEEAKAQIEKEFADMLSWGGISKEEYVEGQKEIFDTWKMLKERDHKPAPATEALYELWDFPDEDEDPRKDCPKCGEPMAFIGYQGYEEEFKCPVCGEYFYFKDGKQVE